jgi:hypothetical protein
MTSNIKFNENLSISSWIQTCRWTDSLKWSPLFAFSWSMLCKEQIQWNLHIIRIHNIHKNDHCEFIYVTITHSVQRPADGGKPDYTGIYFHYPHFFLTAKVRKIAERCCPNIWHVTLRSHYCTAQFGISEQWWASVHQEGTTEANWLSTL